MELLTNKEIKELGLDIISKYIDIINTKGIYERKKFDKYFAEYKEKIGLNNTAMDDKNAQKNVERSKRYIDAIIDLDLLSRVLENTQEFLEKENIVFIRIFDNFIFSEQKIADAIDYNKLLDAIPQEAKEKIKKNLTEPKDIEKMKQDLVSFEYLFSNNHFESLLLNHIENATFQFARQVFCIMVLDIILTFYDIEKDKKAYLPSYDETYKDATSKIKELFSYGKRLKDFKKTEFYLKFNKYINLDKVINTKEFKEEQDKVVKEIFSILNDKDNNIELHSNKYLEICEDRLFKQRWWYYDKEK